MKVRTPEYSGVFHKSFYTVEPRYKEVGTNPSYNKVILVVPALYISLGFFTLIWETWYNKVIFMVPKTSL